MFLNWAIGLWSLQVSADSTNEGTALLQSKLHRVGAEVDVNCLSSKCAPKVVFPMPALGPFSMVKANITGLTLADKNSKWILQTTTGPVEGQMASFLTHDEQSYRETVAEAETMVVSALAQLDLSNIGAAAQSVMGMIGGSFGSFKQLTHLEQYWLNVSKVGWAYPNLAAQANANNDVGSFLKTGGFVMLAEDNSIIDVLEIKPGAQNPTFSLPFGHPFAITQSEWTTSCGGKSSPITIAKIKDKGVSEYCWTENQGACQRGCFLYKSTNVYFGFKVLAAKAMSNGMKTQGVLEKLIRHVMSVDPSLAQDISQMANGQKQPAEIVGKLKKLIHDLDPTVDMAYIDKFFEVMMQKISSIPGPMKNQLVGVLAGHLQQKMAAGQAAAPAAGR